MREIKFRGKRIDNGEWVYGSLYRGISPHDRQPYSIIITDEKYDAEGHLPKDIALGFLSDEVFVVEANSVGQFTGLTDKNGKEIYEGDIVKTKMFGKDVSINGRFVNVSGDDTFEIKYVNAQFVFNNGNRWFYLHRNTSCEIIGNIHDNPELIKQNKEK